MEDFYRQKEAGRKVILAKGELLLGKVTFLLGRGPQSQECWPSNSRLTGQRSPSWEGRGVVFLISVLSEGGGWSPKESQRGFSVFL